jgi:hypothetical protein
MIKHALTRTYPGLPIDPETVNAPLKEYAEELTGRLNAHNFSTGLCGTDVLRVARIPPGTPFHVTPDREESDTYADPADTATADNVLKVPQDGGWHEVIGVDVTVYQDCIMWVMGWACFTADFWSGAGVVVPHQGAQWGISIDGAHIPNTGPEALDASNETFPQAVGVTNVGGSLGIRRFASAVRPFWVGPVMSGVHRIALVARGASTDLGHPIRVYGRQVIPIQCFGSRMFRG